MSSCGEMPRQPFAADPELSSPSWKSRGFDRRSIPASAALGVVHDGSNTPDILTRRALPTGYITSLGATLDFHHGLLGPWWSCHEGQCNGLSTPLIGWLPSQGACLQLVTIVLAALSSRGGLQKRHRLIKSVIRIARGGPPMGRAVEFRVPGNSLRASAGQPTPLLSFPSNSPALHALDARARWRASARGESLAAFDGRCIRLVALLLPQIFPIFSVVAPGSGRPRL